MIVNGSFEELPFTVARLGNIPSSQIRGWESNNLDNDFEVWGPEMDMNAPDGTHHIELDVDEDHDSIVQQVRDTVSGESYVLSFYMRSRSDEPLKDSEAVLVEWDNNLLGNYRTTRSSDWTLFRVSLRGTGRTTPLMFRESTKPGASNGVGPFLDQIALHRAGCEGASRGS